MNPKKLSFVIVGALLLFIGLYIPLFFAKYKSDNRSFITSTNYSYVAKSGNSQALSSQSIYSVNTSSSFKANSHSSHTSWNQPARSAMTMPLQFNTTKWTPSAPIATMGQDFQNTFVTANYTNTSVRHTAIAVPHIAQRNTTNNQPTLMPAIAQASAPTAMQAPRYTAHKSSVYEPFSNAVPSEVNTSFAGNAPNGITNRRNAFITPSDPEVSENSPMGEPWILLIFATLTAIAIRVKTRNKIGTLSVDSAEDKQRLSKP